METADSAWRQPNDKIHVLLLQLATLVTGIVYGEDIISEIHYYHTYYFNRIHIE